MSAIGESGDGPIDVIQVLFALHPSFGAQELVGPLEVLTNALHKINVPGNTSCLSPFINTTFCAVCREAVQLVNVIHIC